MTESEVIKIFENEVIILDCWIEHCKDIIADCETEDDEFDDDKERAELSLKDYTERKETFDIAISALKEIHLYKDNKLCLIPKDVYSRQCSELDAYKEIGSVEECREAVEKLKRAEEALNVILSGNYNDECNFCVHNDNPMANCQCICGDGSWCIHNAKWNGKTSEDENLEGMEDENT